MSTLEVVKLVFFLGLLSPGTPSFSDSLLPAPKGWWLRWITQDLYAAGRLTETQIKYASEVGFKTIISVAHPTTSGKIGEEILPTTQKAREIATQLAGVKFYSILQPGEDPYTQETVEKFGEYYQSAEKPVLVYCMSVRSATFVALSYLAHPSRKVSAAEPKVDIGEFISRAALLGHDFHGDWKTRSVIETITGQNSPAIVSKPDVSLENWEKFWLMTPVINDWFIAGQIQSNHLGLLKEAGIKTVVNVRQGHTFEGKPAQEEVVLLNIKDKTGTYAEGGRQNRTRLEATRIDRGKTNAYISANSSVNYASRNPLSFGDDIGYSERQQRAAFDKIEGLDYLHTPIGGSTRYSVKMWEQYKDKILAAGRKGPVLVHCGSATRGSTYGLLASGIANGKGSAWAIQRANELGMKYPAEYKEDIYALFRAVMGDGTSGGTQVVVTAVSMVACLLFSVIFV